MFNLKISHATVIAGLMSAALSLQGCEGVGLTMLGITGGTAANTGVNHSLGGTASKTFTAPATDVRLALRDALKFMDIRVSKEASLAKGGWVLMGQAKEREIEMTVETLTPRTTRLQVIASENAIIKDSATATEIILQTAQKLDDALARKHVANSAGNAAVPQER